MSEEEPKPPPECDRCGIKDPVIISVLHEPLCPNCSYLRNFRPADFKKEPVYGPYRNGGWPYSRNVNTF